MTLRLRQNLARGLGEVSPLTVADFEVLDALPDQCGTGLAFAELAHRLRWKASHLAHQLAPHGDPRSGPPATPRDRPSRREMTAKDGGDQSGGDAVAGWRMDLTVLSTLTEPGRTPHGDRGLLEGARFALDRVVATSIPCRIIQGTPA